LSDETATVRADLEVLESERRGANARNSSEEMAAELEEQQAVADRVMVMRHKLESDRDELEKQADAVKLEL
jgi:tRNA(Ser,Leu) C12 N-acetylase TAN1